jgi:hypothetical protein
MFVGDTLAAVDVCAAYRMSCKRQNDSGAEAVDCV